MSYIIGIVNLYEKWGQVQSNERYIFRILLTPLSALSHNDKIHLVKRDGFLSLSPVSTQVQNSELEGD